MICCLCIRTNCWKTLADFISLSVGCCCIWQQIEFFNFLPVFYRCIHSRWRAAKDLPPFSPLPQSSHPLIFSFAASFCILSAWSCNMIHSSDPVKQHMFLINLIQSLEKYTWEHTSHMISHGGVFTTVSQPLTFYVNVCPSSNRPPKPCWVRGVGIVCWVLFNSKSRHFNQYIFWYNQPPTLADYFFKLWLRLLPTTTITFQKKEILFSTICITFKQKAILMSILH